MHHSTKLLYDFYAIEDKGDAYVAYLYLKHIDHFIHHVFEMIGLPTTPLPESLGETVDEILRAYARHIADAAPSRETNIYHGKVVQLADAIKLVTQHEGVRLPVSDKVIPFAIARDVILDNPKSIAIGTCACRKVTPGSCLPAPQEVCMIVGDPFASFIAAENPMFRKVSQEEAVEALRAAHGRGDVHSAYFKKEMGRRFFAICNCCPCCCLGMRMWNLLGGAIPFLASSGYVSSVGEGCDGCGTCAQGTCPFNAITLDESAGRAVVDREKCMGCGVCVDACPPGVLGLARDPSKGEPLDLDELKREIASG